MTRAVGEPYEAADVLAPAQGSGTSTDDVGLAVIAAPDQARAAPPGP